MVRIELEPDLSNCIETLAKREYWQSVKEILAEEGDKELQERMEVLKLFLESVDFSKLRSAYEPHLLEDRKVKFVMYLRQGKLKYDLIVQPQEVKI